MRCMCQQNMMGEGVYLDGNKIYQGIMVERWESDSNQSQFVSGSKTTIIFYYYGWGVLGCMCQQTKHTWMGGRAFSTEINYI